MEEGELWFTRWTYGILLSTLSLSLHDRRAYLISKLHWYFMIFWRLDILYTGVCVCVSEKIYKEHEVTDKSFGQWTAITVDYTDLNFSFIQALPLTRVQE